MSEATQYGFRFGAALVERHFEIDGRVCIGITTDTGKKIHVYVSPTGRSLRVFDGKGGEWKAPQSSHPAGGAGPDAEVGR